MLVPADRTEQRWWQTWIEPSRDKGGILETRFLGGRLRFAAHDREHVGPNERPKFGCVLLSWDRR